MLEIVDNNVFEIMTFPNKLVLICRFYVHSPVFCSFYMNMNHDGLNRTLHMRKRLDKKAKVNFKFMMSQPRKQTIAVHILLNISRSKGNQTMKFGQLIEYNVKTK